MAVDEQVFFFVCMFQFILLVAAYLGDERYSVFPFFGGIIGTLFISGLSDGKIITAYAYQSSFTTNTMDLTTSGLIYIPLLMTMTCFGTALWKILDEFKVKMLGLGVYFLTIIAAMAFILPATMSNAATATITGATTAAMKEINVVLPVFALVSVLLVMFGGAWRELDKRK
jgi:hypothetical protein